MQNKINIIKTKKYTLTLLVVLIILSLSMIYVKLDTRRYYAFLGVNLSLFLLAVSLLTCTLDRLKAFLASAGRNPGPGAGNQDRRELTLSGKDVLDKLANRLARKGFRVAISGHDLTAFKHRSGLLGSVVFHLGLVTVLAGFVVNSLWSFHGFLLIPERVISKVPEDLTIQSQGLLFKSPPSFAVALDKFSFGRQAELQPLSTLYFRDEGREKRQSVSMNYPAKFKGVEFRYKNAGYSLLIKLTTPAGTLVNDYANIATHNGKAWNDTFAISGEQQMTINFYPDFIEKDKNVYASNSRFPDNPVMKITFQEKGRELGSALVAIGQTKNIGPIKVSFQGFRYWQELTVSSDPGGYLIYLGAFMAVAGLAWRAMFILKVFTCRVEENESGESTVLYGTRTTYGQALFIAEIRDIFNGLEEEENDSY